MKPKLKPCTECADKIDKPVAFSRGVMGANPFYLCCFHNNIRKNEGKVRQPFAKSKPTGELALFQAIWATRPHVSFLSSKKLEQFNVAYFAHVISKKQWPKGRLTDKNIILLTFEEHTLYDQGTEEQRERYAAKHNCNWNKIYELKQQIKESWNVQEE
jgi:hypothetical protein